MDNISVLVVYFDFNGLASQSTQLEQGDTNTSNCQASENKVDEESKEESNDKQSNDSTIESDEKAEEAGESSPATANENDNGETSEGITTTGDA